MKIVDDKISVKCYIPNNLLEFNSNFEDFVEIFGSKKTQDKQIEFFIEPPNSKRISNPIGYLSKADRYVQSKETRLNIIVCSKDKIVFKLYQNNTEINSDKIYYTIIFYDPNSNFRSKIFFKNIQGENKYLSKKLKE